MVAHHPVIFGGLKKINGKELCGKTIISAIKHDIAIYAIHTNLDNVITSVNAFYGRQVRTDQQKSAGTQIRYFAQTVHLYCPVLLRPEPGARLSWSAGAGHIGHYSRCSLPRKAQALCKGDDTAIPSSVHPEQGIMRNRLKEIEAVFPAYLQQGIVHQAMMAAHPYEEVAYDVVELANPQPRHRVRTGVAELRNPGRNSF